MSQVALAQSIASLRAITYRVSSTPVEQLPHVASQIASSVWTCRDLLSASQETIKANIEASTLVHRLKTRISSLLQDRTIEGRWAGVVLVKALIEAGGVETLSKSNGWVKSLLAILKKAGPPTTRKLATITLTRIFMLTWDYSNLAREITTPALPAFITSSLKNVDRRDYSASELQTVLEAFATLIPRHPTLFRTHELEIRRLGLGILSFTSSNGDSNTHYTQDHKSAAQRLIVLLHCCAPKQGSGDQWDETLRAAILAAQKTGDRLFRPIIEARVSRTDKMHLTRSSDAGVGFAYFENHYITEMSGCDGVYANSDRLINILGIIQAHFEMATAGAVTVHTGLVVDVLVRFFSLTAPVFGNTDLWSVNHEIPKDEREALFGVLSSIHIAALQVAHAMLKRFGKSMVSIVQSVLESAVSVFRAEMADTKIRLSTYRIVTSILEMVGPGMFKEDIAEIAIIIRTCCEDSLASEQGVVGTTTKANGTPQKQQSVNGDLSLQASSARSRHPTALGELQAAANFLLPVVLTKINPTNIPPKLRVQMERTAILSRNKDALVACVMNPARKDAGAGVQTTLLPLLVREYPDSNEVEALLRPRMPPIITETYQSASGLDDLADEAELYDGAVDGKQSGEDVDDTGKEGEEEYLDTLDQYAAAGAQREEPDELYSSTPKGPAAITQDNAEPDGQMITQVTAKRTAAEAADEQVSAKRLRPSPVGEVLSPDFASNLPGPDPEPETASVPINTAPEEPAAHSKTSDQVVTHPAGSMANNAAQSATLATDGSSDDSDFEIPPLIMESDTDPEDEEAEEEPGE